MSFSTTIYISFIAAFGLAIFSFLNLSHAEVKSNIPVYGYEIVNTYPHNTESFTQGLVFDNGTLYESTGIKGKSQVMIIDLQTGKSIKSHKMPDKYFGEGITIVGNKIIQVTWRSKTGFVYNKNTLELNKTFNYETQGWGITYDGKYLIMSDGTEKLYFMDPDTFKIIGILEVYRDNGKIGKLNELEYVDGEIYANIWGKEKIARIDPKTGRVTAWIDLSGLLNSEDREKRVDVLNGIAYNPENGNFYVTGKLWPKLFEIKVVTKN